MKLPRDLSGDQLVHLLKRYGYEPTRQTGSHIRLTSVHSGTEHHITIPRHSNLAIGLLSQLLADIAAATGRSKQEVAEELFG